MRKFETRHSLIHEVIVNCSYRVHSASFFVCFKNRVSQLVMACANRAEIIRKAILNCSTHMLEQSRPFVFHILSSIKLKRKTMNNSISFSLFFFPSRSN